MFKSTTNDVTRTTLCGFGLEEPFRRDSLTTPWCDRCIHRDSSSSVLKEKNDYTSFESVSTLQKHTLAAKREAYMICLIGVFLGGTSIARTCIAKYSMSINRITTRD